MDLNDSDSRFDKWVDAASSDAKGVARVVVGLTTYAVVIIVGIYASAIALGVVFSLLTTPIVMLGLGLALLVFIAWTLS